MKFDELDARMRVFETNNDVVVLPGIWIVVRLDGRGFTRLTKEVMNFEAPFDTRFRDAMQGVCRHLMSESGLRVVYAYTQSDEISLLLDRASEGFGRKHRKLNSILAGEASAAFSMLVGKHACFDSRVCELPRDADVIDYFAWRQEDAHRNSLNAHCYWLLRRQGQNAGEATAKVSGLSISAKNELLFQSGINFNDLPAWQRRGTGFAWEQYEKIGTNPLTGEQRAATRTRIGQIDTLAIGAEYRTFIASMLRTESA
jgi:tRNA(His) guanylyltransferase